MNSFLKERCSILLWLFSIKDIFQFYPDLLILGLFIQAIYFHYNPLQFIYDYNLYIKQISKEFWQSVVLICH